MALDIRKYVYPSRIATYDGTNGADIAALLPPYEQNGVTYPKDVHEQDGVLTFVVWMPWGQEETITFQAGEGVQVEGVYGPEALSPIPAEQLAKMLDVTDLP